MIEEARIACKVMAIQPTDLILEAWKHSRPSENNPSIDSVLKIDLPVNEMAQIQVQLFCPILLREYICTARNHIVWARTSRAENLSKWPVFCATPEIERLKKSFDASVGEIHQDQGRLDLPLGYMTHFTASFSLRDYVNLIWAFDAEWLAHIGAAPQISEMFLQMRDEMSRAILATDWFKAVTLLKKVRPIVGPAIAWTGNYSERSGSFIIASMKLPLALRAQAVRSREVLVRDNLRDFFIDEALSWPISTMMFAELAMTAAMAKKLCSQRNCWIAQEGLWAPLLALLREQLDGEGNALPCDETGACPFVRDNELRAVGKDPAPPCPRWRKLSHVTPSLIEKESCRSYSETRSDSEFWKKEIANA